MSWLGSLVGDVTSVAKHVTNFVTNPVGEITGDISSLGRALAGRTGSAITAVAMPGGASTMPRLSTGGAQGGSVTSLPYLGSTDTSTASPGILCDLNSTHVDSRGKVHKYRRTKNGHCTWHKKPSMNAMNPHAAKRAINRITKARRMLWHIERSLPKQHHRAGKASHKK